jgi:hypothetical protein
MLNESNKKAFLVYLRTISNQQLVRYLISLSSKHIRSTYILHRDQWLARCLISLSSKRIRSTYELHRDQQLARYFISLTSALSPLTSCTMTSS